MDVLYSEIENIQLKIQIINFLWEIKTEPIPLLWLYQIGNW
jgi:hypothetical protein